MPPNAIDVTVGPDPEIVVKDTNTKLPDSTTNTATTGFYYKLQIFQSTLNILAHILIGAVVGISILFSFRNGTSLGPTPLHIVLCVIGYQLLMAEAILALSSDNGWSSKLRLVDKRRAHWILQIVGSGLAIAGSIIKVVDKTVNWNTLHGQFALVAMVFTGASLVNGVTSLYAHSLKGFIPASVNKISHILFGTVAFVAATISLCYGFKKNMFVSWATLELTNTIIAFSGIFTFIAIINPVITFYKKSMGVIKK